MNKKYQKMTILFAFILIFLLSIPTLQGLFKFARERTLYGYTDPIPDKPKLSMVSFFDKSLQQWVEKKFNARFGFRADLIRSFNEINFRIFRETDTSRLKLMTTKQHGLYSNLSIDSLNCDLMHKRSLEREYQIEAQKLYDIQNTLAQQGTFFIVVIASSKAYIYPKSLGKRLIKGGSQDIFKRAANLGAILKAHGVHVIDSGPILRHLAYKQKIETHPVSGLHWNYYAACFITNQILTSAQTVFPKLATVNCGQPKRIMPPMNDVDVDGYSLLNVWSHVGVVKPTTYPTITTITNHSSQWKPKMVFIGDSFSDQMRFVLKKANIYSSLVMSSYLKRREVDDMDNAIHDSSDSEAFETQLMADIKHSDIVVLEMVDYNIHRGQKSNLYGFADYFLHYNQDVIT